MKRKFLLFAFAILLANNVLAQYQEYQLGLMAQPGYNWLMVSNENISNVKNKFSYKYGLFGSYYFNENYGLSSGIYMLTHSSSYDFKCDKDGSIMNYNHDLRNSYLQVPVLLKGRTDLISNRFRILGEFGAGFDFLIDNKDAYRGLDGTSDHFDVKYRTFGTSLVMALGTEILIFKNSGLMFKVVYDKNFVNLIKDTDETKGYYSAMKMTNLYLEIGFFF